MAISRADRGRFYWVAGGDIALCVLFVEPGLADFDARAEPDTGVANDDDFYFAFGFFLGIYFSARDDAVDFLLDRVGAAGDLLYRIGASDCVERGQPGGLLGEHCGAREHGRGP